MTRAERLLHSGLEASIYSDIAAALVVLTGRRVSEILVTAQFSRCTAYSVWFTGQLKTRGKELAAVEIPTLIEASRIIDGVSRLRELFLVDDTNRDLLDSYKNDVRCQVIRTFCDLVPTIQMVEGEMRPTTHRMRAVYNCLATFFYAPPGLKDDLYTKVIMAHEDRNSTLNYMVYQIADEVIAASGGKRQGILLDRPGVKVLQVFQTCLPGRAEGTLVEAMAFPAVPTVVTTVVQNPDAVGEYTDDGEPSAVFSNSKAVVGSGSVKRAIVSCQTDEAITVTTKEAAIDRVRSKPVVDIQKISPPQSICPSGHQSQPTFDRHTPIDGHSNNNHTDEDEDEEDYFSTDGESRVDSDVVSHQLLNSDSDSDSKGAINLDVYLAICQRLLSSPHFGPLATGLVAVTGRSVASLIKSGIFKLTDSPHQLLFSHQLSPVGTITTLLDSRLIVGAIEHLRYHRWTAIKRLRYEAPNQIEYIIRPLIQRSIKKFFASVIPDVSYSGLIAAYELLSAASTSDGVAIARATDATDALADSSTLFVTAAGEDDPSGETNEERAVSSTNVPNLGVGEPLHLTLEGEVLQDWMAIASGLGLSVEDALPAIVRLARRSLSIVEGMSVAAAESRSQMLSSVVEADSMAAESRSVEEESDSVLEAPSTYQLAAKVARLELQLQQVTELISHLNSDQFSSDSLSSSKLTDSQSEVPKKSQKLRKFSSISNQETGSNLKGRALQKIDRTVIAVMQFNEQTKEPEQKWFISESLIFRLTGCNRPAVRRYFEALRSAIDEHNQLHQLSERHNQLKAKKSDEQALQNAVDNAISLEASGSDR
ncbi:MULTISPECIES: protelomerase family protein [Aerosakkonema]|uniref:protelomerase family protein n=1 Tax=Aerosakkonema TaxID=1246629 RepID=UPI0035B7187D